MKEQTNYNGGLLVEKAILVERRNLLKELRQIPQSDNLDIDPSVTGWSGWRFDDQFPRETQISR